MFPKNSGFSPQIIHFNRVFLYKSSILGTPIFSNTHFGWEFIHPNPRRDFLLGWPFCLDFSHGCVWRVRGGDSISLSILTPQRPACFEDLYTPAILQVSKTLPLEGAMILSAGQIYPLRTVKKNTIHWIHSLDISRCFIWVTYHSIDLHPLCDNSGSGVHSAKIWPNYNISST